MSHLQGPDTIPSVGDVELLKRRLQPGILQLHNHQPDYAHLDFELVRCQFLMPLPAWQLLCVLMHVLACPQPLQLRLPKNAGDGMFM